MIELKRAKRSQAKLKLAVMGASGSGKTASSLLLAYGLLKAEHPQWTDAELWDKVCIIDTENASGSLYVGAVIGNVRLGEYNTIQLGPPFEAKNFIDSIHVAEDAGMEVIIIDSLTHAWSGEGGALDKQGKIAERSGNSYTAWRSVTPEHNRLVDAMLQSKCHMIAALRAKTEYSQIKEGNKTVIKNMGVSPIFRDGIEYEFSLSLMLDADHIANPTKDRTGLFDGKYFTITPDTGKQLHQWLSEGATTIPEEPKPAIAKAESAPKQDITVDMVDAVIREAAANIPDAERAAFAEEIKNITGGIANYKKVTDPAVLAALYNHFKG